MLGTKQQNNSILVERHKGLTIVINIDLPKFQIVKKLAVINWNKPHKFRRRGRVADYTGLENRSWGNLVASSNLAVSSIYKQGLSERKIHQTIGLSRHSLRLVK